MYCECGVEIDEKTDTYYKDDNGVVLCIECANEKLKVPVIPGAINGIVEAVKNSVRQFYLKIGNASKLEIAIIGIGAIVFPSMATIVIGYWKIVYAILGLIYLVLFSAFLASYARK